MKNLTGKKVVLTGAGSGIGRALALELARQGCHLAISDINEKELQNTRQMIKGQSQVLCHRLDVGDKKAFFDYADEITDHFGNIDIVINNAGVTVLQDLSSVSIDDFEFVMRVNFWGVVYGTKAFLPHLKTRPQAAIINISSVNAFLPFPNNGPYNCSKYAVCGFNETLHQELEGSNVLVASVHPGGIKTNIVSKAKINLNADSSANQKGISNAFSAIARTTAEEAARVIVRGIKKGKKRIMVGMDAYIIESLKRMFPETSVKYTGIITEKLLKFQRD